VFLFYSQRIATHLTNPILGLVTAHVSQLFWVPAGPVHLG